MIPAYIPLLMLEPDGDGFYVSEAVKEEVGICQSGTTWNDFEMDFLDYLPCSSTME